MDINWTASAKFELNMKSGLFKYACVCLCMLVYARVCSCMLVHARVCSCMLGYARACSCMLEYARVCSSYSPPDRTVIFAFWKQESFNFNFKQFISPKKWQWLQNVNKLRGGGPCLGPLRLLQFKLIFCWFACDRPALVGPLIIVAQLE